MRFWKEFIGKIQSIKDAINNIYVLLIKKETTSQIVSNPNPILTITNEPTKVFGNNCGRKKTIVQNIGLEPCYIKLGHRISRSDFHFVLAPDTSSNFGNGGSITLDNWHGEVYAITEQKTQISVLEY